MAHEINQLPTKRSWRVWLVGLVSFGVMLLVLVVNTAVDGGSDLALWMGARPGEVFGYLFGRLFAIPIICMVVAGVRNAIVFR